MRPTTDPQIIETWMPRLWVRGLLLVTPIVVGPMLLWLAVTEPEEFVAFPRVLVWLGAVAFVAWVGLAAFRARVSVREDGVVIRGAVRDRLVAWDHLHGAAARWGGLELRSYEPWSSDFERYATGGIIIHDWRRPWRWSKRAQPVADRINEELRRRHAR